MDIQMKDGSLATSSQLSQFLHDTPLKCEQYTPAMARRLKQELILALTASDSDNLKYFVSDYWREEILSDPEGEHISYNISKMQDADAEHSHGKMCGKIFKAGDLVYRCTNCGFDATCVQCRDCFKATDHEGHNTSMSVASTDNGCCDCGDPEAWKTELFCKIHSDAMNQDDISVQELINLNPGLPDSLDKTIREVFDFLTDYILGVFSLSPIPIARDFTENLIREDERLIAMRDGTPLQHRQKRYSLVLWNDEKHAFPAVIDQVCKATKRDELYADEVANTVDRRGRCLVETSSDIHALLEMGRILHQDSLAITIRPAEEVIREEMCHTIIDWMFDLLNCSILGSNGHFKNVMFQAFFSRVGENKSVNAVRRQKSSLWDSLPKTDLAPTDPIFYYLPISQSSLLYRVYSNHIQKPPDTMKIWFSEFEDPKSVLRIDSFLCLDIRLWKPARATVHKMLIALLTYNLEFKRLLGIRFGKCFEVIIEAYLNHDREMELSMKALSIQFLTVPSITEELLTRYSFFKKLWVILFCFFTPTYGPKAACELHTLKNRKYFFLLEDIKLLLQSPKDMASVTSDPDIFINLVKFLKLFQGIHAHRRAAHQHVEYESDGWLNSFHVCVMLSSIIVAYTGGAAQNDIALIYFRTLYLSREIFEWAQSPREVQDEHLTHRNIFIEPGENYRWDIPHDSVMDEVRIAFEKKFELPYCDLSTATISIYHPLHLMLAGLLKSHALTSLDYYNEFRLFSHNKTFHKDSLLMTVVDHSCRVLAWTGHIKANYWVRNGYTLKHQASYYRGDAHESFFLNDIFLLQFAFCAANPEKILALLLDRYDLVTGSEHYESHQRFDDTQLINILEDFLSILVVILSERSALSRLDIKDKLRRELIHSLCFTPLAFSAIQRPYYDKQYSELVTQILEEIATYRPPGGNFDSGVYKLDETLLAEVDPYCYLYTRNQKEESEILIKRYLSKSTGKPLESIVIKPRLLTIDNPAFIALPALTSTRLFCNILFDCIQMSLQAKIEKKVFPELILDYSLHLVLIALEYEKSDQSPDSFSFFACTETYKLSNAEDSNLVKSLLLLQEKLNYDGRNAKLDFVLEQIEIKQKRSFASIKDQMIGLLPVAGLEQTDFKSEEMLRKENARKRQQKVMADFQKAQAAFMSQNMMELSSDDEDDKDDLSFEFVESEEVVKEMRWEFLTGICIVCQEAVGDDRSYGTLGMIHRSSLLKTLPGQLSDEALKKAFSTPDSFDVKVDRSMAKDEDIQNSEAVFKDLFWRNETVVGLHATSCNHIMHASCYDNFISSAEFRTLTQYNRHHADDYERKEFICPLCKSLCNAFFPVFWKYQSEISISSVSNMSSSTNTINSKNPHNFAGLGDILNERLDKEFLSKAQITTTENCGGAFPYVQNMLKSLQTKDSGRSKKALLVLHDHHIKPIMSRIQNLKEVVGIQQQLSLIGMDESLLTYKDEMQATVSYTIAAYELAQRGSPVTSDDLNEGPIPPASTLNVLTFLRILNKIMDISKLLQLHNLPANANAEDALLASHIQIIQVLVGLHNFKEISMARVDKIRPFLEYDSFDALVALTQNVAFSNIFGVFETMKLCYWAELCRSILFLVHKKHVFDVSIKSEYNEDRENEVSKTLFNQFVVWLCSEGLGIDIRLNQQELSALLVQLEKILRIFLRKCVVFFQACLAVNFDQEYSRMDRSQSEFSRLTALFGLPALLPQITGLQKDSITFDIISGWIRHLRNSRLDKRLLASIKLPYPGIYELVPLPGMMDTVFDMYMPRICTNCNTQPLEPAICLFCGALVCAQSWCCSRKVIATDAKSGECNIHMLECEGTIGAYFMLKKSTILFLHCQSGSFMPAPYLDVHGEADMGLKRNKEQTLSQRRYDSMIRDVWLTRNIPNQIARRMEATTDPGGWTTM